MKPERLNLAISRRCFVSCPGCFSYFGAKEPDLDAITRSVEVFASLGVDQVTVSGGDPLTIHGFTRFLHRLRSLGIRTIKVDTVGTGLLEAPTDLDGESLYKAHRLRLLDVILPQIDYLGIPLDGWSNDSSAMFRIGRPAIHDETIRLLDEIDNLRLKPNIVVNTVVHRGNINRLEQIFDVVARHRSICNWSLFQYTPTDQVQQHFNDLFQVSGLQFHVACRALQARIARSSWLDRESTIEFRDHRSRLGQYLLINSDGNAWIPGRRGETIRLGTIYGREREVLRTWARHARELREYAATPTENVIPESSGVDTSREATAPSRVDIISKVESFSCSIFRVEEARLRYERFSGKMSTELSRLCLVRGDSVAAVVHERESNSLIMVEQFRYPTYETGPGWIVELPAGIFVPEKDLTPENAMRRELIEEIGYAVGDLLYIGSFYLSPGGSSERIHLYYVLVSAKDRVRNGGGLSDEGEDIRRISLKVDHAFERIETNEIVDAKTLVGLYWLRSQILGL